MAILVHWKNLLPRLSASIITSGLFWNYGQEIEVNELRNIAGVLISLAGTLLGFLITAMALIISVMDRTLISNMKKTGHYRRLMNDTLLTCCFLLSMIILSVISLFIRNNLTYYLFILIIFVSTLGFAYLVEAGKRFAVIISVLD